MLEQKVPVKPQARELGADISYCCRKAASQRNKRTTSGLSRLFKLRVCLGPCFGRPACFCLVLFLMLHATETSSAASTVLQHLRSGAARAVGCGPKGASPWLACLLASYRCADPEFVLVMNRIHLFRQGRQRVACPVAVLFRQPPIGLPQAGPYEVVGDHVTFNWVDPCG